MDRSKCPNGSDTLLLREYMLFHTVLFISHVEVLPALDEAGLISSRTIDRHDVRKSRTRCSIQSNAMFNFREVSGKDDVREGDDDVHCCDTSAASSSIDDNSVKHTVI